MKWSLFKTIGLLFTLGMGFVMVLFMVEPVRVIGWVLNPVNKQTAVRYLDALTENDLQAASAELARNPERQKEWVRQMEELRAQGLYAVRYNSLVVPHDREHMDGRTRLVFAIQGVERYQEMILTFAPSGINQACIMSPASEAEQAWNRLNCHY
ncbi:hypothetical protein ACHHV8_21785 [Paenibacillus sp. TAB 01]|uniref:hypothetical protein n=1 Tax=Paenibacillus sp. TAB 01 TaxID=3368988 RepID=UPI003753133B